MVNGMNEMLARPPVWEMIKEAVQSLGGSASHRDIIAYIHDKYGPINKSTIRCQITICSVNSPSRIYYPENSKARKCDGRYDFLYSIGRGEVTQFDPARHGKWEIASIDGKLTIVQNSGNSKYVVAPRTQKGEYSRPRVEVTVFCPACKKDVTISDERAGKCPVCGDKISELFEKELRAFLSQKWGIPLRPQKVKIGEIEKCFDLVSDDANYIGDAKFYKSLDVPAAKWSTIAEYVWLLQFTKAKSRFLIFGRDRSVPQRWLNRHRSLVGDVKFYFFNHRDKNIQELT